MKRMLAFLRKGLDTFWNWLTKLGWGMRAKLLCIFLLVKVVPLILVTFIAATQVVSLGNNLRQIAVSDSSEALNNSAVENIERMTTDAARQVAEFLYDRDDDLLYLASIEPTEENYAAFIASKSRNLVKQGEWVLAADGKSWVSAEEGATPPEGGGVSNNSENNDLDGFHYRKPDQFEYESVPLYDEITFIDLNGMEQVKVVSSSSRKVNYPLSSEKKDVSVRQNTFIKAETYFEQVKAMKPGEIYVSDVIGAYVGSNYIGMYVPDVLASASEQRGYNLPYLPEEQAYSGMENPVGERFEGIVRFATPVADESGETIGYVTFALNHDHIMEFVDHLTPMNERYTELPNAFDGNYAFIWDYQCRSICHPRHHSIVGFDPTTGNRQVPWLEESIYNAWKQSSYEYWYDFVTQTNWPTFDNQSRSKKPSPILTREGNVGLDGRYLNNAPQCTGWMDLSVDGGSGSFYILWSGLYKLTTAAAIPYYTGQYAPSEANGFSWRGFGVVTIGAGMEDFTRPATETEGKLTMAISENLGSTFNQLFITTFAIIILLVFIALWLSSWMTDNITRLIKGIGRFRAGERQFRFDAPVKDEFGILADSFDDMAESIVESGRNPLSITDMDNRIIYMNDNGLHLVGHTLEEVVGTQYGASSLYPEASKYDPILALHEDREAEIYFSKERDRYLRGKASYLLNKNGESIGYIIESTDVTEMVREQMKIEEQRTLLDQVFTSSPDMIWYMDAQGHYLTVNPRFAAIAGISAEEFIGKTGAQVLPSSIAEGFYQNDLKTIQGGVPLYSEETLRFADGHQEVLDSVRTPVYEAGSGRLAGLLGFARNVDVRVNMENELRNTQLELEKAVNDANRANKHKGDFLARMSHEIRTPMNAIIGITHIVQRRMESDRPTPETMTELRGHMGQIESSSQHLLGLLNDILDISKIDAGKIELTEEVVELSKLVETVGSIIKPRCEEKNITFLTNFDTFTHDNFLSDSLRLRQVLINLLGNAVKFTQEFGAISFDVRKLEEKDGRVLVSFSIRDTGIGIPENLHDTIFEAFEQGGAKITGKFGGTGLGLAISQRIVELFGGRIHLKSAVGEGSEFSFELWLTETKKERQKEKADLTNAHGLFAGHRMLLVDDVELNRVIVKAMLEDTGITIDEANDGIEAIERFRKAETGAYDIILMDVQMPGMDGYEAAQAIRSFDREDASSVIIVALTANAFKEDIQKALQSGMDAHMAKPVEIDTLLSTLDRYLGKDRQE